MFKPLRTYLQCARGGATRKEKIFSGLSVCDDLSGCTFQTQTRTKTQSTRSESVKKPSLCAQVAPGTQPDPLERAGGWNRVTFRPAAGRMKSYPVTYLFNLLPHSDYDAMPSAITSSASYKVTIDLRKDLLTYTTEPEGCSSGLQDKNEKNRNWLVICELLVFQLTQPLPLIYDPLSHLLLLRPVSFRSNRYA